MSTYSSDEVREIARISTRQLDYWARRGVAVPTVPANGSGTQRRYSEEDLAVVCFQARLALARCRFVPDDVARAALALGADFVAIGPDGEVADAALAVLLPVAIVIRVDDIAVHGTSRLTLLEA